jgi:putative hemolysin
MATYTITPLSVPRSHFLDGLAECATCGAHVQPSMTTSAFVRRSVASSASAFCAICGTTTDYQLEPRRVVITTTSADLTR